MTLPVELQGLPPAEVIDEISFESQLTAMMVILIDQFAAVGFTYDVEALETDPAKILMETAAYIDINLRQRINEAIRANLLPYAAAGDLDILANFYDVARLIDEGDDALKVRVVLAIQGRSTGGTAPRYKSIALGANADVADAAVYTVGRDPTVHVALFSHSNSGVASQGLIGIVNTALQDDAVRMVNDTIVVAGASRTTVNIEANVWLLPQAPQSIIDDMEAALQTTWASDMGMGRDLSLSWLFAQLHLNSVQRLELLSPMADIIVPFNESAALGTVTLNLSGRDF